jgi:hypothetical protein
MSTGGGQRETEGGPVMSGGGRSGTVTAVAIVSYVWGALGVVCGVILMVAAPTIMGLIMGAAEQEAQKQGIDMKQAKGLGGIVAGMGVAFGLCGVLLGGLPIIGGIGVQQRKQWGRILLLIVAAIFGVLGVLSLMGNPIGAILNLGYCIFVYVILLQGKYAAEFR